MMKDYLNLTTAEALQRVKKEYDAFVKANNKRVQKIRKTRQQQGQEFAPEFIIPEDPIF